MERRKFLRIEDSLPVRYTKAVKKMEEVEFKDTIRVNIGGGGVKLILEENLPKGTILAMHISIPDPEEGFIPVFATGRVVWSEVIEENEKYGVGVEFLNIDEEDRRKIVKYVESRLNK
jgi:c-di-GMP-binding flagellar brake protein YcgR